MFLGRVVRIKSSLFPIDSGRKRENKASEIVVCVEEE